MTPKADKVLNIQSRELVCEIDLHFPSDAEIEYVIMGQSNRNKQIVNIFPYL